MKTTRYLYDIDPFVLSGMLYEEAIAFKIERAKALLHELVHIRDEAFGKRVEDIGEAIAFNEGLLDELRK